MSKYTPRINKRYLLYIAAAVWLFAGGMLMFRGSSYLLGNGYNLLIHYLIGLPLGIAFYQFLIKKIAMRHIDRIKGYKQDKVCTFAFFDVKSYIMMGFMMALGLTIKQLDFVDPMILYTYLLMMGTPLILASVKFMLVGRTCCVSAG
jgi:hypothetical protein